MSDIALVFDPVSASFDWALDGSDLLTDDGLTTATFISWFCDRRADPGDVLPDEAPGPFGTNTRTGGDRRGWWGDFMTAAAANLQPGAAYSTPADRIGSKFWQLKRRKMTAALPAEVQADGMEALGWMEQDGIATNIDLAATPFDRQTILLAININLAGGLPFDFAYPVSVGAV